MIFLQVKRGKIRTVCCNLYVDSGEHYRLVNNHINLPNYNSDIRTYAPTDFCKYCSKQLSHIRNCCRLAYANCFNFVYGQFKQPIFQKNKEIKKRNKIIIVRGDGFVRFRIALSGYGNCIFKYLFISI